MKKEVIDQIRKGNLKTALKKGEDFLVLMKEHYYNWTIQQSRFNDRTTDQMKGVISQEEYKTELNRINSDLLDLVLKIDNDVRLNFSQKKEDSISLKEKLQNKLEGRYNVLDIISEGTSTVTYKVEENFDNEYAALRVMKTDNLFKDTDAFDEINKIKRLNHRNIISVSGKSPKDSAPKYVLMEYVKGVDIETLITENGSRPISETKRILLKICNALYYLHQRKIFNADLRASRILLDIEGEPMLSPFIIFRTKSENNYEQIISNLKYMSYQRLNSKDYKHYSPESNQFSVGVIAYLLLVGKPLFESKSLINLIEDRSLFQKDEKYRSAKLSEIEGPKELIDLVTKLLAKDRKDRFKSMLEVVNAVKNLEDDASKHHNISQESYSRACSCNHNVAYELIEKMNSENIKNLSDEEKENFAFKLNNAISLIIETNENKIYVTKILESKEILDLFLQNFEDFKSTLYSLLESYDYLWTEKIHACWETTLNETHAQILVDYSAK